MEKLAKLNDSFMDVNIEKDTFALIWKKKLYSGTATKKKKKKRFV